MGQLKTATRLDLNACAQQRLRPSRAVLRACRGASPAQRCTVCIHKAQGRASQHMDALATLKRYAQTQASQPVAATHSGSDNTALAGQLTVLGGLQLSGTTISTVSCRPRLTSVDGWFAASQRTLEAIDALTQTPRRAGSRTAWRASNRAEHFQSGAATNCSRKGRAGHQAAQRAGPPSPV